MGQRVYPDAHTLFITADAGGSNGYRSRTWKHELQKFADDANLPIQVSHSPPGTSKWNKIEHRLFCHITQNWRGRPLPTIETIVDLIGNTRTEAGLCVEAALDTNNYDTGVSATNEQMDVLSLHRHDFRGEWNYDIRETTWQSNIDQSPKPSQDRGYEEGKRNGGETGIRTRGTGVTRTTP